MSRADLINAELDKLRCPICGRGKHPLKECSCVIPKRDGAAVITEDLTTYWAMHCVHGNVCIRIPTLLHPAAL